MESSQLLPQYVALPFSLPVGLPSDVGEEYCRGRRHCWSIPLYYSTGVTLQDL